MKKVYKIEVDCANCANKIQDAVEKIEGVEEAKINFMLQKLTVTYAEGVDVKSKLDEIVKLAKKIEPDFVLN